MTTNSWSHCRVPPWHSEGSAALGLAALPVREPLAGVLASGGACTLARDKEAVAEEMANSLARSA